MPFASVLYRRACACCDEQPFTFAVNDQPCTTPTITWHACECPTACAGDEHTPGLPFSILTITSHASECPLHAQAMSILRGYPFHSHHASECPLHVQAMSILRGQLPWRKRARPDTPGPASPAQPLRATMSAPIGSIEAMTAPSAEEPCDGEWPLSGPHTFERWRDMIERCGAPSLTFIPLKFLKTPLHL